MPLVHMGQSGYVGLSMSVNATSAYEDRERPKSKWTKSAMLQAIKEWSTENYYVYDPTIEKMTKDQIFDDFFVWTSWHHTAKFANKTDFYAISTTALENRFIKMTPEEIDAFDVAKQAEINARIAEQEELKRAVSERKALEDKYIQEHGYAPNSVMAYIVNHPGRAEYFTSKKGTECVSVRYDNGKVCIYQTSHIKTSTAWEFSDLDGCDDISSKQNIPTFKELANEAIAASKVISMNRSRQKIRDLMDRIALSRITKIGRQITC